MNLLNQNSAILESHYYGINGSAIKYTTRNNCSEATAKILEEMAKILFPQEEIEIYVIPAKDGCHQDSFLIKVKNNPLATGLLITFFTAVTTLPNTISQIITDTSTRNVNNSQISLNQSQEELNQSQEELNQLQIKKIKEELNSELPDTNISEDQCKKIIESPIIKRNKNKHFEQLQNDAEITEEKFVAVKNNKILKEKTIKSIDFHKYIENLPETKTLKTIEKNHKLNVIKSVNDKDYKTLMWNFEDVKKKEKFGAYMADDKFYVSHLEKPLGLKTLTVRMKYTIEENELGVEKIKNKEIIKVYKYNDVVRIDIPKNEKIEPAPFEIESNKKENFEIIEKKEIVKNNTDQLQMF